VGARGPKRDLEAKQRILDAAVELISSRGPGRVGVNDIATAAGVGKQTIYRWWPSKTAVVIDALEQSFEADNPLPVTGTALDDLRLQMRRVAISFASPKGAMIRELVAESQRDRRLAQEFRSRFLAVRRDRARQVIERGMERGELRHDLHVEVVIDALYGPLWLRLLTGHLAVDEAAADAALALVWPAISTLPSATAPESTPDGGNDVLGEARGRVDRGQDR